MEVVKGLRLRFKGKRVRIVHFNNTLKTVEGRCTNIFHSQGTFSVHLANGCWDFTPEIIASNFVEGPLKTLAGGRRRIEIVSET